MPKRLHAPAKPRVPPAARETQSRPPAQATPHPRQLRMALASLRSGLKVSREGEPAEREAEARARTLSHGWPLHVPAPAGSHAVPLPEPLRAHFERGLGKELGDVRLHTHAEAAGLALRLNARAFTHQRNIYFGPGEYAPGTAAGRQLLAHEVAHSALHPSPTRVFRQQRGTEPAPEAEPLQEPTPELAGLAFFEADEVDELQTLLELMTMEPEGSREPVVLGGLTPPSELLSPVPGAARVDAAAAPGDSDFELQNLGNGVVAVIQRGSPLAAEVPSVLNPSAAASLSRTTKQFAGALGERAALTRWGTENLNVTMSPNFPTVDIRVTSLGKAPRHISVATSTRVEYFRAKLRALMGGETFEKSAAKLFPGMAQAKANELLRSSAELWVPEDQVPKAREALSRAISSPRWAAYREFIEFELAREPVMGVSTWAQLQALAARERSEVIRAVASRVGRLIRGFPLNSTQLTRLLAWRANLPATWETSLGTSIFRRLESRTGGFQPLLHSLEQPAMKWPMRMAALARGGLQLGRSAWASGSLVTGGRIIASHSRDAVLRSLVRGELARRAQIELVGSRAAAALRAAGRAGVIGAVFGLVVEGGTLGWDAMHGRVVSLAEAEARLGAGAIGVVGSAALGAAIGSVVPVTGTAVGFVVGVVVGLIYDVFARPHVEEAIRNVVEPRYAG